MTIAIRWLVMSILCLVFSVNVSLAQTSDELIPIESDEPLVIMLNDQSPMILTYDSSGNETISITVRNISDNTIDTVLELLYPDERRLAYNDDYMGDDLALAPTDSALVDVVINEAGEYIIRVNSYGNIGVGEVEVLLSQVDRFQVVFDETETENGVWANITVQLPVWASYTYQFTAQAGDMLSFTARDLTNRLDPFLTLRDSNDMIIAENDDHGTNDLTLNVFDAQISDFVIPEDGVYTIVVNDFLGNAGQFVLVISQSNP